MATRGPDRWHDPLGTRKAARNTQINLRLVTEGRGTQDGKIEAELDWITNQLSGKEAFQFKLPPTPYSFTGHLTSLQWGLELSIKKSKDTYVQNITLAPDLKSIDLPLIDEGKRKSLSFK